MDEDIEWLSTADAANRLGINTRTLYRLIDDGQIPAYKFGRVIRVQAKDVAAFVESAKVEPGSLQHLYTT
jgi:excisionase family DNA binding protein